MHTLPFCFTSLPRSSLFKGKQESSRSEQVGNDALEKPLPVVISALHCFALCVQIVAAIMAITGIVMMAYADGFQGDSIIGVAYAVGSASTSALYKVGHSCLLALLNSFTLKRHKYKEGGCKINVLLCSSPLRHSRCDNVRKSAVRVISCHLPIIQNGFSWWAFNEISIATPGGV